MPDFKAYLQALISALLGKCVQPYKPGDVITFEPDFLVAGRVTDSGKNVMLTIGLSRPFINESVEIVVTKLICTIRGDKGYVFDQKDVTTNVAEISCGPFGVTIRLEFSDAVNATNNTPVAVQVNSISLSFT